MRNGTFALAAAIVALVILFLVGMVWLSSPPPRPSAERPARGIPDPVVAPSGIAIPVVGARPSEITDTSSAARAGGRVHDAIDIMAPAGTPVIAAAAGTIEKLYFSRGGGGITVYVRSPDRRWMFYYAHLQAYAPGLHEGDAIGRGDPIGFVGSTGNASAEAPHLHFAISRMAPEDQWWRGTPINPYPLLVGNRSPR